jgi:hypothetical protein
LRHYLFIFKKMSSEYLINGNDSLLNQYQ